MDWTMQATKLAALSTETEPRVFTFGRRLIFRGRVEPALCLPFLAALDRYLRDDDRLPAVMATGTRADGRWCVVTTLSPELADEDWGLHLADAGLRALGFDKIDLPDGYYRLIADEAFQRLVWQALAAGRAGPALVAELLAEGI